MKRESERLSMSGETYGRLTGRKRWAIILLGTVSGAFVALLFSWFSGHGVSSPEVILGAIGGAFLGWSASLGEVRRKKSSHEQPRPPQPTQRSE